MTGAEIKTERIDDIPLLIEQQREMGIPGVLDNVIDPHGNRQGLSVGWLTTVWLSYIVSESDHRMSEVESWVEGQIGSLTGMIPERIGVKDFTDDRLSDVLRMLSVDEVWEEIESQLGRHLVRVYDLGSDRVRMDSTSAAVYHDEEGHVLFRKGYSKDHRPDLAQFKVMLGALDPMGMPVGSLVVSGNEADDGLYIPSIRRIRQVVGQGEKLYIGDSKMSSLQNRTFIEAGGDHYLVPLARTGEIPEIMETLLESVWDKKQPLKVVYTSESETEVLALGFEASRSQEAQIDNKKTSWQERVLVIYSPQLAKRNSQSFDKRLSKAEKALCDLTPPRGRGKRQKDDLEALKTQVQAILKKYRVEGFLEVDYHKEVQKRSIRRYKDRPNRTEEAIRYVVDVRRNQQAIDKAHRLFGWRLYATNAPSEKLSLNEAVRVFRKAPNIERNFSRLKGHPLGIRPLYVQRDDHAKGMIRLLCLALRLLTLVEYIVRENLKSSGKTLSGLYPGNPKRKTDQPTTERLLKAFRGTTLTVVKLPSQTFRHVTPLSELQKCILTLLGLPISIYENLALPVNPIPP